MVSIDPLLNITKPHCKNTITCKGPALKKISKTREVLEENLL